MSQPKKEKCTITLFLLIYNFLNCKLIQQFKDNKMEEQIRISHFIYF